MNQEENNPFTKGDEVYHCIYGKGLVIDVQTGICPCFVSFDKQNGTSDWYALCALSFEPWPKPVHVKPVKVGWWIIKVGLGWNYIGWVQENAIYAHGYMKGNSVNLLKQDVLHQFLSDDPSYFSKN